MSRPEKPPTFVEVMLPRERLEAVEDVKRAVLESLDRHANAIAVDPSLTVITLIVRLDRGPTPDVLFRTEARDR